MKKLSDIVKKMTRQDAIKLKVFRHPHRKRNLRFKTQLGLNRSPSMQETIWLNNHTTDLYSIDDMKSGRNISFKNPKDAVLAKLTWYDDLICEARPYV
jgi:hypothetical protein